MNIRVFIVDDHYMVIEGIRSLLQNESRIEWLGHAMNADSCLAFLRKELPDIILMDISMPGISGIELCREVRSIYPSVFVIGLSTFNQQSFISNMIDSGASGYILKNASREEIMEAMDTVMAGKTYLSLEAAGILRNRSNLQLTVLTRREKEILELIAEGMTNNEIASRLFVSATTVDTHRKNLLLKMDAKNTAALVRIAMEQGLLGPVR